MIQTEYLQKLIELQREKSYLEFKTDHRGYFDHALKVFQNSAYKMEGYTYDLHQSEFAEQNFVTHFESIFLHKGQPIYYALLSKN